MKLVVFLILAAPFIAVSVFAQTTNKFREFREAYESALRKNGIIGSSFIFVKDNKVLAHYCYGSANLAKKQPIDENTIYHWASNTKPFTGIAIMQLRDRGLLNLNDAITKYLPELEKIHNPYGKMSEITIRELMNHSAGFRNPTFPYKRGYDWEPFEPTEYSQLEAMLPFTTIMFPPGGKYSYSNLGIVFLGQIIERISGDDFEVYIDKNILRPLEMHHSYFDSTPYFLLKNRSHSYYIENGVRTEGRFDADSGITVSNSGLNSPLTDMVKYVNFLLGDESKKEIYDTVLKRASLEEMFRPTIAAPVDANGNLGWTTDIGLIFFIDKSESETFYGHGGDQNGFISYLEFNLRKKTASLIVFNTNLVLPENAPPEKDMVSQLRRAVRKLHLSF
ncbi:MAG: serine hydrolase domain-containing protein [Pyrinomonadaceae bacterium]